MRAQFIAHEPIAFTSGDARRRRRRTGLTALTLDGMIASEGGVPILVGGKIIGAMGCSGGTGQQDGVACQAGANALQ